MIDLGSLNGTWVNGRQVHDWAMVKPGDIIQFGEVQSLNRSRVCRLPAAVVGHLTLIIYCE